MAADSVLNLQNAWNATDVIVCGDCCSTQANFNAGTTFVQTKMKTTTAMTIMTATGERQRLEVSARDL